MLTARRQPKFLRRPGPQPQHPLGQPLRVQQFARARRPGDLLEVRVARILLVEPAQGGFEAARITGLECLVHSLGLIADVHYAGK